MTRNRTNTLLLTVIGVATLLVSVIGATFAYFTANLTGGEDATTITVGAGKLSIDYQGDAALTAENLEPEVNTPAMLKNFTITGNNTTTAIMPYTIELIIQESDFTDDALSYSLESANTSGNGVVLPPIAETKLKTGAQTVPLGNAYFSGAVTDSIHTYVLKIFFQETFENQDQDKGKTFAGYVNTRVGEIYTTSS